ncbi:MAG TPA: response regulator [Solirubrobacteraceae bacterium]|jgi:DNA-binding response OmpR family regulator|nr:response regulator [Solirubrobacteraceae bacterium]
MHRSQILIVDDHALSRTWLTRVLEEAQLDVAGAATLSEAQRLLDDWTPAGIVLDLRLPDGPGLALAQRCRADPRTAGCAIIACTAGDHPDEVVRAFECGCDAYVTKPIDTERFAHLVTTLIQERAVAGAREAWTRTARRRGQAGGVWVRA